IEDVRPGKDKAKDPITLGERRTLAKSNNPKILEKLLFDPDDRVIAGLLNNPHILEKHVLRICSRRPTRAAILKTISFHPKWGRNMNVRFALVQNPYTPPIVATLSMVTASAAQLSVIAQLEILHPAIRNMAAAIVKEKKASSADNKSEAF